ncbi:MAG: tetratricopeptide repeat protein [Gammaproteobacteria bacterium]|nr:tetratricopeptide repeat protein [Gammaproteobacteria bacterium]MBT8110840.1 tetratricopeptide repeat protein [Gammaproteobacteria bacterium]NNL45539.1 tetratricopeptide repeat protein [Woeseiaceae bacterium]
MINVSKTVALLFAISTANAAQAQAFDDDDDRTPLDQLVPVADESPDLADGAASADDARTLDQKLAAEFDRYQRLVAEDALDEADASAKRIVQMVISIHGPQSLEASRALNNLALVQNKNGQYGAAIQNFESAVEIIETVEDRLNEKLVNPLRGLGAAQIGSGRPDLARRTFNRATHITHVNEGPHNLEQVEILESLAQSAMLLGDSKGARNILNRIHVLNARHFEGNDLAMIPSLLRRASWQHAGRYYLDERATYRRAIRILEANLGKEDPQLILPLSKLGQSYYFVDLTQPMTKQQGLVTSGEMYFKRAARIAEATPEIDWRILAETKLALADHYMYVESFVRARKIYAEVWDVLSADQERLAARAEMLEQPVALTSRNLPKFAGERPAGNTSTDGFLTGTIRVDYSVSTRGRIRSIRTEAIPPQFTDMQKMVHNEMKRRIFRPRMSDGGVLETDNLVFEHSFFYRQADLDKLTKKTPAAEQQSADENSES